MKNQLGLWALLGLLWPQAGFAQGDCEHFANLLTPFGPGDRQLTARVRTCGAVANSVELYVFYAEDRNQLNNVSVGGTMPHGQAKVVRTEGQTVEYSFIFPHTDHRTPNPRDTNPTRIRSGRTVFIRLLKRVRNGAANLDHRGDLFSFKMPDKLTIASVGDSFASGEGAPVQEGASSPTALWTDGDDDTDTDVPCHRSKVSGQSLAVKDLKDDHPELAIAFKNVACSGAVIANLWSTSSADRQSAHGDVTVPFQFDLVKNWLNTNRYEQLDILLMSIGGNNVGFSDMVFDFLILPQDMSTDEELRQVFGEAIGQLPSGYDGLNDIIHDQLPVVDTWRGILITGYPDPTRSATGGPCGGINLAYGWCWGPVEQTSSQAEYAFVQNTILRQLNDGVRNGAAANGWDFIDLAGVAPRQGLCNCDGGFFNVIGQSLENQDDIYGMVHPNREGHDRMYKPRVNNALEAKVKQIRDWAMLGRLLNEEGRAKRVAEFKLNLNLTLRKAAAARQAAMSKIQLNKATQAKMAAAAAKRLRDRQALVDELRRKTAPGPKRRYALPRKYQDIRLVSED
jgi:hypothetical protein